MDETIVAVFDTAEHAAAAVRDLVAAGIPESAITKHAGSSATNTDATATTTAGATGHEQGFWASLFGGEPDYGHDTAVYDRSLQGGSTVVSVKGGEEHMTKVLDILERHNPVDIDERAATYGVSQTKTETTGLAGAAAGAATGTTAMRAATPASSTTGTASAGNTETLQLSEEQLVVGKRAVNRGTTRVRRYVVETPVEEQVSLHNETVTIERRPVTDGRAVGGADFSDKVIEVTETGEEAVVSKQAHVREEVVIRKDATDRTETVRDTVRREDVEIVKEPGTATASGMETDKTSGTVASAPYKPTV